MGDLMKYANEIEGILREKIHCKTYGEFGIKANDNIFNRDWKSPIYFVLGYHYAISQNNENTKKKIENFIDEYLDPQSINDLASHYEYYKPNASSTIEEHLDKMIKDLKVVLELR